MSSDCDFSVDRVSCKQCGHTVFFGTNTSRGELEDLDGGVYSNAAQIATTTPTGRQYNFENSYNMCLYLFIYGGILRFKVEHVVKSNLFGLMSSK